MVTFSEWDQLLYGIERGSCTLFLGPALPLVSGEGERRLPLDELTRRLASALANGGAETAPSSLPNVAQRFRAQEGDVALEMEISRWYESLEGSPSLLHDDLAALPWRWIVTSGHDPLMADALQRAGKPPHVERYHYRGTSKELLPSPSVEKPVLCHLYGHVAEPSSLVVTDTQLLDFLASLIARDPPIPNNLNDTLANGRLFLFLGFGLHQWYLRMLLRVLKVLRPGNRGFAIETVEETEVAEDAILFYKENFKLGVYGDDVLGFVHELRQRYEPAAAAAAHEPAAEASPAASAAPTAALAPDAPTVFICHASEDADWASRIHDALRSADLRPWLDREALRGGDRWNELIESTIEEVDYFVVVNSSSLAAKSLGRSYVNKEINRALKADELRLVGSFIIPALIDDTPLLEPLHSFQAVDLQSDGGLLDLVRAIKRQLGAGQGG